MISRLISALPANLRDNIRGLKRFRSFKRVKPQKQLLIYFADGTNFHGGLADRFKGMISLFAFCMSRGVEFRIEHSFPFNLTDFLTPNIYNWQFRGEEKISFNVLESKYLFLIGDATANRLTNLNTKKQLHCLANRDIIEEVQLSQKQKLLWGDFYRALFKPTDILQKQINHFKSVIAGDYISLVFRFQNLLGDFDEYSKPELANSEKKKLIAKCKKEIETIRLTTSIKILITSDSQSFLKIINDISNKIYSFPEKVVHIDNSMTEKSEVYMKSLVDFYLLADSKKVFSIGTKEMYLTEFPEYAAKVNNIEFKRILIN